MDVLENHYDVKYGNTEQNQQEICHSILLD